MTTTSSESWAHITPTHLSFPSTSESDEPSKATITALLLLSRGPSQTHTRTPRIITSLDDDDCSIRVHDPTTGTLLRNLCGHTGGVWALGLASRPFSSSKSESHSMGVGESEGEDDAIVSGSTDRTVRLWDLEMGRNTHVFRGHTSTICALAVVRLVWVDVQDGDGSRRERWPKSTLVVSASRDWTLRVWRVPARGDEEYGLEEEEEGPNVEAQKNPYHLKLLSGHARDVRAVAAYGRIAVSGSYDATLRIWDIITGECKFVLIGHIDYSNVVLDSIHMQVASASRDHTIRLWSVQSGQCLHTFPTHLSTPIVPISLSPTFLASISSSSEDTSTIFIWNTQTGALQHTLKSHTSEITSLHHDDHKLISGPYDELKMWNIQTGTLIRNFEAPSTPDSSKALGQVDQMNVAFDKRYCVGAGMRPGSGMWIHVWDFGKEDN